MSVLIVKNVTSEGPGTIEDFLKEKGMDYAIVDFSGCEATEADVPDVRDFSHLVIMGGPMMGFTLDSIESPIVKTSNCIIAGTEEELPLPPPAQACIRCGYCVEACPMELLPQQLFWYSQSSNLEQAEQHNIMDCIECGACSYVCPSSIPLVHVRSYGMEIYRLKLWAQKKQATASYPQPHRTSPPTGSARCWASRSRQVGSQMHTRAPPGGR